MAEVLVEFQEQIAGGDGVQYTARVCGRPDAVGLWEGWIEFTPTGGGAALATGQETTQPNREDLFYWATGLTAAYLEGALHRAETPALPPLPRREVDATPAYAGPAGRDRAAAASTPPHAVLDPFAVYGNSGDKVLRDQLKALDTGQLRNIVKAYGMSSAPAAEIDGLQKGVLVDLILTTVESRA